MHLVCGKRRLGNGYECEWTYAVVFRNESYDNANVCAAQRPSGNCLWQPNRRVRAAFV